MGFRDRALAFAGIGIAGFLGLWAYASYRVRRFEDLDPESAGAPGAFVDIDGARIHYVDTGRGEPVVLIHGFNGSTFGYRYTIAELARHYRVVAIDLLGCGYSARPAKGDYSLTAQAELVARVMDRLGVERAAVAGHSMGGSVAMRLALGHPARVSRLVLVDAADDELRRGERFGLLARPFLPIAAMLTLHRRRFRRLSARTAVHDPAHLTPEMLEGYFRPTRMKGHLRAQSRLLVDRRRDEPLTPERVSQPALVLWGEHDHWIPLARGEELAAAIPNARLVVVPSAGHLPLEEQPDFCNRALLEFLRSTDVAPLDQAGVAATP